MVIRGPGPAAALSTSSVSSKTSPTLGVWKALIPLRHPTEAHNMASKCAQRPTRLLRLAAVTVKLTMPLLRRHSSSAGKGLDADQELRLDEEENAVIWPTYLGMKSGRGHVPGGHQQSPLATTTVISMTAYRLRGGMENSSLYTPYYSLVSRKFHIPPNLVVGRVTAHWKPPEVRICRLRNQSAVGTRPPSTSTPHCPACWARR
jgi:hypothetical protein